MRNEYEPKLSFLACQKFQIRELMSVPLVTWLSQLTSVEN